MQNKQKGGKSYKSKNKGKGNQTKYTNSNRNDKDIAPSDNNPTWYAQNVQMLKDAASLSFSNPIGSPLTFEGAGSSYTLTTPGVLSLDFIPTPGIAKGPQDPVNVMSRMVLTAMTQNTGRSFSYDAPDLAMYLLGMDSCFSVWSWLTRIYGVAQHYEQENRYLPDVLLRSMHVNPDDIRKHANDLRWYINSYAAQMSSLVVPKIMNYFTRHAYILQNIFKDTASPKSQLYIYNPKGFYCYNETSGNPGYLEFRELDYDLTFDQIKSYVDQFLQPFMLSEDIARIGSDLKKAYGDALYVWPMLDEKYQLAPVFDLNVLTQIHNATILPGDIPNNWNDLDIRQDVSNLSVVFQPNFVDQGNGYALAVQIDLPFNYPTPEQIMEATRNTTICEMLTIDGNESVYRVKTCGAEIITGMKLYSYFYNKNSDTVSLITREYQSNISFPSAPTFEQVEKVLGDYSFVTKFDWHPLLNVFRNITTTSWIHIATIGLIDNNTVLELSQLEKMNYTALMSLFNVPNLYPGK